MSQPSPIVRITAQPKVRQEILDAIQLRYADGFQATDARLDEINRNIAEDAYRLKYEIPFPHELKRLRNMFGLSGNAMSSILGLGINSWRLYESGELPQASVGKLLKLIIEPETFVNVARSSGVLDRFKILELEAILERTSESRKNLASLNAITNSRNYAVEAECYQPADIDRLLNMVAFFTQKYANEGVKLYKTTLNKLLFYADFGMFRESGRSISGWPYVAIYFGPVPHNYQTIFGAGGAIGYYTVNYETIKNKEIEVELFVPGINSLSENNLQMLFTDQELNVMDLVFQNFKIKNTTKVVELSHEELGWLNHNKSRGVISYPVYAPMLKNL